MNKEKEKGVATSLVPWATCWPLASLVPRRYVLSVGTCSPSARVLRRHVFSDNQLLRETPHSFLASFSLLRTRTQATTCALGAPFSFLTHTDSLRGTSAQLRVPPSSGAPHPTLRQSGEDTPPSLSFSHHRDRPFSTCTWLMCCGFSLLHPTTVKPSSSWCGVLAGNSCR